jgi:hypothetical protein
MTRKLRLLPSPAVLGIFSLGMMTVSLVGTGLASAASISFIEDPAGIAPIVVNTDIVGATIETSLESASLSVGNVIGPSTLIEAKALIQPGSMLMEGGGMGVSDILELFTFLSATGATVGFQALFQSDNENGLPTPGNLTPPDIVETGTLQVVLSTSVTLPGMGPVGLTVSAQSDRDANVPEPSTLALITASLIGLGIIRRRRPSV